MSIVGFHTPYPSPYPEDQMTLDEIEELEAVQSVPEDGQHCVFRLGKFENGRLVGVEPDWISGLYSEDEHGCSFFDPYIAQEYYAPCDVYDWVALPDPYSTQHPHRRYQR